MEINEASAKFKSDSISPMHTAEHILNGTMAKTFGCGRAFSAHIERKKSKCDYHLEKALTTEDVSSIEDAVNNVIEMDLPVWMEFATQEQVQERFDMDRLPDDASEQVRIVHIGDYDECLCVGNHAGNAKKQKSKRGGRPQRERARVTGARPPKGGRTARRAQRPKKND